jgi:methionyl-tRNA synthetase
MIARNLGSIPEAGALTDSDHALLATTRDGFPAIGGLIERHRQKAAVQEAMRIVGEANTYLSQQAPWKLRTEDPDRMRTVLNVAAQAVDDCKTLLTPFLPHSAQRVHEALGQTGRWSDRPQIREVDDLDGGPGYPVLMLDDHRGDGRWASTPIRPGTPVAPPTPVFAKLDPSIVEEELSRLEQRAGE